MTSSDIRNKADKLLRKFKQEIALSKINTGLTEFMDARENISKAAIILEQLHELKAEVENAT